MRSALFTLLVLAAIAVKGEYFGTPPTVEEAAAASEDFIAASLLTISPGQTMYSLVGHSALRMRMRGGRDLCFSYESEDVSQRVLGYLAGRLKMGMFAVPTSVYLDSFRRGGRTIRENALNLSPEARLWLWQTLDWRAREGVNLPYDHLSRGCAKTTFKMVCEAAGDDLKLPEFPKKYDRTLREILADAIPGSPWSLALLHGVTGIDADADLPPCEKVILPEDLLEIFSAAQYKGWPFLGDTAILLEEPPLPTTRTIDPLYIALAFLVFVILLVLAPYLFPIPCSLFPIPPIVQAIPGAFLVYLVFFSSVPSTGWNWLLVPFNPLPLCAWPIVKRKAVSRVLGGILLVWTGTLYFWPHRLTHPAYLVMGLAFAVFYLFRRSDV